MNRNNKVKAKRTIEDKKEAFLEAYKSCLGIATIACKRTGIGRTMLYEYRNTDSVFAAKMNALDETAKDFVESKLIELVIRGDRSAIMFYLKAKAKDRGYR